MLVGDGRDFDEPLSLPIAFDGQLGCWQAAGENGMSGVSDAKSKVLAVVEEMGEARLSDIARAVKRDVANVRRDLVKLVNDGLLSCEAGTYRVVDV